MPIETGNVVPSTVSKIIKHPKLYPKWEVCCLLETVLVAGLPKNSRR